MQSVEPMMMGSPTSSPSGHNQSAYLPSYLLGHASPLPTSPNQRMWSGSSNSPSKNPWPMSANKSATWSSPAPTVFSPANREIMAGRGKDKTGAPPVQGLLEHITSPVNTPDRHLDFLNQSSRANQSLHSQTATPGMSSLNQSNVADSHVGTPFGRPQRTSPSPAQIDPFYTQGESIGPSDELDETWVTVFGFPAAAASFILQQFSQYGNILKHVISSEGNWLHIHYQSKLQAKKALSKNGKVFGSSIMVGVTRCIDKNVMDKENSCPTVLSTPNHHQSILDTSTSSTGPARHTPIRPLTAAYRAASNDQEVLTGNNTPQKNNNIVSKAMEYMFGW